MLPPAVASAGVGARTDIAARERPATQRPASEQEGPAMDWSDTPEQEEFRMSVRSFIQERLPDYYRGEAFERRRVEDAEQDWQWEMMHGSDEAKAAAQDWSDALAEHGWNAPNWPTEYGGSGLSTMEQFILKQELGSAHAPEVGGGNGIPQIGPTLLVHGTDAQKEKFLGPTLRGEMLWAQGYSEPGAGSDLASLQTRAIRDGDEYVINGQKMWTSTAHKSNWLFGMFRTDPDAPKHRGITFMLMEMHEPEITVRPIIAMDWRHATNETFFEDMRVPVDQVLGEVNRGWYVGMTLLDFERSGIAGAAAQREVVAETVEAIQENAIPNRGTQLRSELAERAIEVEVNNNLAMRIASMQASGLIPNYEASMGKAYTTELEQRLSRTGMKIFGLYGGLWDADDERSPLRSGHTRTYVSSVVGTIAGGSSEIQRNIIATRGLGLPRG
ncbi:MAG: acyl-CoA dehydrogenase family protein [Chloroflexota bacterium]|nr:acyl-CoA dehydrogenase family protein [Chloroflexota bacterium]